MTAILPIAAAALRALALGLPVVVLVVALLSLAAGFQWLSNRALSSEALTWLTPGQSALVFLALLGCALRFGAHRDIRNWPLLAVAFLVLQTVWLSHGEPGPSRMQVAVAAFALALPWLVPQVRICPGFRRLPAFAAALTPMVSVGLGWELGFGGAPFDDWRVQGATNSGWLAFLAYAGFAICLHEAMRGRWAFLFGPLALVDFTIAVLSAGRMAVLACVVHALAYGILSPDINRRVGRFGLAVLGAGAAAAAAAILLFLPTMQARQIEPGGFPIDLSGRDELWASYFDAFLTSPAFGLGLGAASSPDNYFDLPHNEYLRILVEGGLVGFTLFAGAVLLWAVQLIRRVQGSDRAFVTALLLSCATYALTDNVLLMPPGLMAFVLVGIVISTPALPEPATAGSAARWLSGREETGQPEEA